MTNFTGLRILNCEATGANIRKLMKKKGIKVAEIAEILLTTSQAVYKWLNGQCAPSIDNLLNLAGILGVTLEEILVYDVQGSSSDAGESEDSPAGDYYLKLMVA